MDRELCLVKGKSEVSLLCIWLNRTSFPKIRNSRPQFRFPLPIFHAPLYKYAVNCRLRLFFEKSRAVLEVICSRAYVYPSDRGELDRSRNCNLLPLPFSLFLWRKSIRYPSSAKRFRRRRELFMGKPRLFYISLPPG